MTNCGRAGLRLGVLNPPEPIVRRPSVKLSMPRYPVLSFGSMESVVASIDVSAPDTVSSPKPLPVPTWKFFAVNTMFDAWMSTTGPEFGPCELKLFTRPDITYPSMDADVAGWKKIVPLWFTTVVDSLFLPNFGIP